MKMVAHHDGVAFGVWSQVDKLPSTALLTSFTGIDGNRLGLTLHHEKLGHLYLIHVSYFLCFACIKDFRYVVLARSYIRPNATGWSPPLSLILLYLFSAFSFISCVVDLVVLVQNTVREEQDQSTKRPIYLAGESLGASLALLVAAHNPDIDFVLILTNPGRELTATKLSKCLVQSVLPLSNMILHNQLNAGLLNWMSSIPVETVMWKLKMIQEMQTYLNSHLNAVKALTMIFTSGKDMLLTSITEDERLSSMLQNSQTHSFIGNDDPLFGDHKFDLVAAIKCASLYRCGASADYVADFLPPSPSELESACEPFSDAINCRWKSSLRASRNSFRRTRVISQQPYDAWTGPRPDSVQDGKIQDYPMFDVVRMTGGVPVSANNLYRLFSLKSHVLLYPGGVREALHHEPEFVRMAARFGEKIVPFGTVGEDDILQLLLDCGDQMKIPPLKALIEELTNETARLRSNAEGEIGKQFMYCPVALPKLPGRFYFLFGEPISTEGKKDVLTNKDRAREVYLEVKAEKCIEYLKDRREKDPYRNLLVRLSYQSYHGFDSPVPTFEV
ncbi:hypothetical protein SASPL_107924 [Salvia splendens]|uniref:Serine aminopeptidase S33 domain-containing protein n=1 Tax=Salvia splendens TaxID=180675 RepID=A0A8X9A7R6_SALSN|nr:hypothetical protein SASPL_107924 [Salvia splendens]